jgi:hypothetical protein
MAQFERKSWKFLLKGLQLNRPIDLIEPGYCPTLKNIRSFQDGSIQPRPGINRVYDAAVADLIVHSCRRLNNDLSGASQAYALFVGAGDELYKDNAAHTSLSSIDTGYSGNPLSLIPFRPLQSPEPYLYVSDSLRLRKTDVGGTDVPWGIARPAVPLSLSTVEISALAFNNIQNFNSTAGLSSLGTASSPSTFTKVNTTISQILYDSGSTGWALINPAAFTSDIQPLSRIVIDSAGGSVETVLVESVYKAIPSTTIASITYDSGSTGLCTVVLADTPREGLVPNAMIRIASAENVRILSVTIGPNGQASFRCSTTGARAAGNAVAGLAAFRANCVNTHSAGQTLTSTACRITVSAGTGTIDQTININAATISGRATTSDDFFHISIRVDKLSRLDEGKLILECDSGAVSFEKNYFYVAFRPNDFVPAASGVLTQLTTKQRKLQRRLIDKQEQLAGLVERGRKKKIEKVREQIAALEAEIDRLRNSPITTDRSSEETTLGESQWTEFVFRLKDLNRVGPDTSRGLGDIKAWRLSFTANNTIVVDLDDFFFGGGFGPDSGESFAPYLYMYRYRSSTTGARSGWSPIIRNGVIPRRQSVVITPLASGDSQVDKIDIARFGGTLLEWHIIGTMANSGSFTDDLPDDVVASTPLADFDVYQPFPILDIPRSSTVNVTGTAVTRTAGDTFNTSWAPGSAVIINGVTHTIYSVFSTSLLHLTESAGSQSGVTAFFPEPLIQAQPLTPAWGPFGAGESPLRIFACGDPNNPGFLYYTAADSPDECSGAGYLELTSPSEPLMNGVIYDGRNVVASSERWFIIVPSSIQEIPFEAQELPVGRGLFARWGIAVGPEIYFVGRDGIYATSGGVARSLTDATLYPLFPHDGIPGTTTNGIAPPDFTQPNAMRLSFADEMLYFDFIDTGSNRRTLIYDLSREAWLYDQYTPGVVFHYNEEGRGVHRILMGGNDGRLYSYSGAGDNNGVTNSAIACQVRTPSLDFGDPRSNKRFGDYEIDADPASVSITSQIGFDNYTTLPSADTVTGASRARALKDIDSGDGTLAKNIAVDLSWSSNSATPKLYEFHPSFLSKPENVIFRGTDPDDLGYQGAKFIQGLRVRADTYNTAKSFKVQSDTGAGGAFTDQQTFTITHDGEAVSAMSFDSPFIAHLVRLISADTDPWQLLGYEFIWEPSPELVEEWEGQDTTFEAEGFFHLRDLYVAHVSSANITLAITTDGTASNYTIAHGSGAYKKTYVPIKALKQKSAKFRLSSSSGFRLFLRDCEVRWKSWGSPGPYLVARPFGDLHREVGARI